jgi:hypothetical protein
MLSRITLLSLLLFSSPALAQRAPAVNLPPINLDDVPAQCNAIAKQAGAVSVPVALSARISLANCIADIKLAKLTLLDCEDSMLLVDDATKQSFELIDGVIAGATDESTRIVGEQAKAELYNQMTARMLKTVPAHDGTPSSLAMYNVRKSLLDGLLVKWKDAAAVSYENIVAIVKAKPALEKNPVVAIALRTAKDRLRLHVASAKPVPAPVDDGKPKTDTGEELR